MKHHLRRQKLLFVAMIAVTTIFSCQHPDHPIVGTLNFPGATGDVQVEKADHGQRLFSVVIDEIPAPSRIKPELQEYLLWAQPLSAATSTGLDKSVCAYDAKLRQAKCALTTAQKNFRLLMSAEAVKDPSAPSDYIIAERHID